MASVAINPSYRDTLARLGLRTAQQFLDLPGVIVCGHPDRHVAHVTLGTRPATIPAFLKREHRVPWKDRLGSAWAGFGFVARSSREWALLHELTAAGIGCPEPMAVGEDDRGRAFLLLRELPGCRDLRAYLAQTATTEAQRCTLAAQLGTELARIHAAGFDHPDLYSKHVLVSDGPAFHFLDWQRSRRRAVVGWPARRRDLAALAATLADELASPRVRLTCLRAYLRAAAVDGVSLPPPARAAREILQEALRLRRRRRIRELLQPALASGRQNLVWLDGEALCVTREFLAEQGGRVPAWLSFATFPRGPRGRVVRKMIDRGTALPANLVRRRGGNPLAWLWAGLRGRRVVSPELERAGLLFRLQRHEVTTPRLLAVGQRPGWAWRSESFLLTEPPLGAMPLAAWLATAPPDRARRQALRQAGAVLRRIHEAGCCFSHPDAPGRALCVQAHPGQPPQVILGELEGLRKRRSARRVRDLRALHDSLTQTCGRTDLLRLLRGYVGKGRLSWDDRQLVRVLLAPAEVYNPASGGRKPPDPANHQGAYAPRSPRREGEAAA